MDKSAIVCGVVSTTLSSVAGATAVMQMWPVTIAAASAWLIFMAFLTVRYVLSG